MEQYHLAIFVVNTIAILVVTAMGYFFAPVLMSGMGEPDAVEAGVRTTRSLLPVVVALYMFFNCLGFFQGRTAYLLSVSGLVLFDLGLQLYMRRKRQGAGTDDYGDDD